MLCQKGVKDPYGQIYHHLSVMIPKKFYIFDLQFSTKFPLSLVEVNQASFSLVISIDATMKRSCWLLGLHTTHCHIDKIFLWFGTHFTIKKNRKWKSWLENSSIFLFFGTFFSKPPRCVCRRALKAPIVNLISAYQSCFPKSSFL